MDGLSQDTDVRDHGTSKNIGGPKEGDIEPSLCGKCSVLRIEDKKWSCGVQKHDDGRGPPFVIFPEINGSVGPEEKIELAYKREDTCPDLPLLEQGATDGCEFCKLLRESLREDWDLPLGYSTLKSRGRGVARIRTRKITYCWTNMILNFGLFPAKFHRVIMRLDYDWVDDSASPAPQALFFELFSDQGPLASWLRIRRYLPPTSYLHPKVLSQIKAWLDSTNKCVDFSNETQSVPTRLIDVGPSDGTQQPHLVVSREDFHTSFYGICSYVALSHCWGEPGDLQLKTTTCVLERFRREIPLESCPETFRDAIKFVRAIGLRYLWIDALCIIQDDQLDWERESVKMYEVYSRAHLTIVPLKSESPKMGFLERSQRPRMKMHFISTLDDGINGSIWLQPILVSLDDWGGSPSLPRHDHETSRWVKRAWTLQESEFSRRLLYFGNKVVSFQTYGGHKLSDNGYDSSTDSSTVRTVPSIIACLEAGNDIEKAWSHLIQGYADRDLTFPCDRLPAISALAGLIQNKTKDVYLAGLWLSHLHLHLYWQADEKSKIAIAELVQYLRDPVPYIAPSWSWARMKQKVRSPILEEYVSEMQILEASTVPEGLNTFGAVSHGHLVLRGKICHLKNHSVTQESYSFMMLSVGEELIAFVDIDGALDDGEKLHVNNSKVQFRCDLSTGSLSNMAMFIIASTYGRKQLHGLLLIPKETGLGWLRIGTFKSLLETALPKFFDSCETADVRIV